MLNSRRALILSLAAAPAHLPAMTIQIDHGGVCSVDLNFLCGFLTRLRQSVVTKTHEQGHHIESKSAAAFRKNLHLFGTKSRTFTFNTYNIIYKVKNKFKRFTSTPFSRHFDSKFACQIKHGQGHSRSYRWGGSSHG